MFHFASRRPNMVAIMNVPLIKISLPISGNLRCYNVDFPFPAMPLQISFQCEGNQRKAPKVLCQKFHMKEALYNSL